MIDTRLAFYLIWGVGVVVVFSVALAKRLRAYRRLRRDRRSVIRYGVRRDVVIAFALWIVSLGASLSIFLVLFGEAGSTPRTFALALALGGLLGAGLVMATEDDEFAEVGRTDA